MGGRVNWDVIPVDPPTQAEVISAINKLRSSRVPESVEYIEGWGECCSSWLTRITCEAWDSCTVVA